MTIIRVIVNVVKTLKRKCKCNFGQTYSGANIKFGYKLQWLLGYPTSAYPPYHNRHHHHRNTQIFPGGNNKATILTNVYFVLNLYNFPCCIDVHNLCIDVRCIVINN